MQAHLNSYTGLALIPDEAMPKPLTVTLKGVSPPLSGNGYIVYTNRPDLCKCLYRGALVCRLETNREGNIFREYIVRISNMTGT